MQVAVKALSVNFAAIYKRLENKTNSSVISMHFVLIRLFAGFSLKNRSLLKNLRGVRPSLTQALIFLETRTAQNIITFCVESYYFFLFVTIAFCGKNYYILRYYYILCQLLQYVA